MLTLPLTGHLIAQAAHACHEVLQERCQQLEETATQRQRDQQFRKAAKKAQVKGEPPLSYPAT